MKLKTGDLIYTIGLGFPYDRTDDGNESFEGVSGTVIATKAGAMKDMVDVRFVIPMKTSTGMMDTCLFWPNQLVKENRPWLKKHLKQILAFRKQMKRVGVLCNQMAGEEV